MINVIKSDQGGFRKGGLIQTIKVQNHTVTFGNLSNGEFVANPYLYPPWAIIIIFLLVQCSRPLLTNLEQ